MDKKVLRYLKNYIKSHSYGRNADYTLQTLFQAYESRAIMSLDGLFVATQEFVQFLFKNKNKILKTIAPQNNIARNYFEKEFDQILFAFDHISDTNQLNNQALFVKLSETLYDNANSKILDVGAGGIPLTSFLFTTSYDNVSSMDKFLLSDEFLKSQNIDPHNRYFTKHTDISSYDFVVGRKPCSAIPSIVERCAKENKPYFLELCGCHLDHMRLTDGSTPDSWEQVLPDLDPNIAFIQNYAFNVDASESQVVKLIEHSCPEIHMPIPKTRFSFLALSFLADCFNEIEQELLFGLQ